MNIDDVRMMEARRNECLAIEHAHKTFVVFAIPRHCLNYNWPRVVFRPVLHRQKHLGLPAHSEAAKQYVISKSSVNYHRVGLTDRGGKSIHGTRDILKRV